MVRGEIMPVPEGQITGSQLWQGEPVDLKQYEVITTYKVRKRTVVSATDEAAAIEPVEEELIDHEKCPCFYGGGCPTDGRHLPE